MLEQVNAYSRGSVSGGMIGHAVQELVNALAVLRGKKQGQLFGLEASYLDEESAPELEAAILAALRDWRAHFATDGDVVSLTALDKVGRAYDVRELMVNERFPLRCDPLGTRDKLPAPWITRLERLEEIATGAPVDLAAVHWLDESAPRVVLGTPDEQALYEYVLDYEARNEATFPRELAAFAMTANGIFVNDHPLVWPVASWSSEAGSFQIGGGSTIQGALAMEGVTKKHGLLGAKVVDRDDDGVEVARYADFATFLDALLGYAPKKTATKKTATKKPTTKKPTTKKPTTTKPTTKKPTTKKPTTKKPTTKKPTTKKPTTKKPTTKKPMTKKPMTKKPTTMRR